MQLSFPVVLFLIFLILKLCSVIAWSWWWITAPIWIVAGIGVIFVVLWLLGFAAFYKSHKKSW